MSHERLERLIRTIYAVGGGAAALSMAIFLRSESLELSADLVAMLQLSWAALFYAILACAALQLLALGEATSAAWRVVRRALLASGFFAFALGLVLLAYASAVALADANTAEDVPERSTSA